MLEFTYVMIKPNVMHLEPGKKREVISNIMSRYMDAGLNIYEVEEARLTKTQSEEHYSEHKGKEFYEDLTNFMADDVLKMIVYGEDAVSVVREINGPTNVLKAMSEAPNSIRALYGDPNFNPANAVHASDSPESAEREINYFYPHLNFKQPKSVQAAREFVKNIM